MPRHRPKFVSPTRLKIYKMESDEIVSRKRTHSGDAPSDEMNVEKKQCCDEPVPEDVVTLKHWKEYGEVAIGRAGLDRLKDLPDPKQETVQMSLDTLGLVYAKPFMRENESLRARLYLAENKLIELENKQ